jgi:hypothetical protein
MVRQTIKLIKMAQDLLENGDQENGKRLHDNV